MSKEELKELDRIKKLLMLALIKSGATSDELDLATDMGAANIRRMFPITKIKKYPWPSDKRKKKEK